MGNSQAEILARILDNISDEYDKTEGSFFYDLTSPAAIELALVYTLANTILAAGFAQTTSGTYLDYRAGEHGITRKASTKAAGTITFTGTIDTVIPSGSLVATVAGVQFQTTAEVTIGGGGTIDASTEAVLAGTSGNKPAGSINSLPVSIAGVSSVTNAGATTGGTDTETDAELLERYLEAVREPATSGNSAHYKQWANEVSGVGDARVFPLWDGAGTVKVLLIDTDMQPVESSVVTDTAAYIEEVRPIGATVTVASAAGLDIDVSATVSLESSAVLADIQTDFTAALTEYLKEIAFEKTFVSYAVVGSLLLNTDGVVDYTSLLVNSGTSNVTIADTEVAIVGTVSLSE